MAKVIFGVALTLVVYAIYSFAQDTVCEEFCDWSNYWGGHKCNKTVEYCRRRSPSGDKIYIANYKDCNCCNATCIEMVGKGGSCNNEQSHYFKVCTDGICEDGMCV